MSRPTPLVVVTDSTDEPLTRAETKLWLRIEEEETHEDELVTDLIAMARQRYEEYTGRSLLKKTYDFYVDSFPGGAIDLPRWPLVSVESIKGFTDTDDTDTGGTAMSTSGYYVDTAKEPGRVMPFGGVAFPTATRVLNAGIVRFIAGHTSETTGTPEHARQSLKNMIAYAYENRGDQHPRELQALMDEAVRDELTVVEWG